MNTQLNASPSSTAPSHPPSPHAPLVPAVNPVARTSVLDRAAMRVGLWLLLWGSRSTDDAAALERHRRHAFRDHQRARHEAVQAHATRLWLHRG